MKFLAASMLLLGAGLLGSCAQPLEQIMDQHREEHLKAVYSGRPLNQGAGDGLGAYIAEDAQEGLTMTKPRPGTSRGN